ncbi:MAG: DNA-formamidopyrimidine glycosylase [Turicibacter sp.]|nr:DNA-formamidopyrimidine glycosylase [Turicibacter sp.]
MPELPEVETVKELLKPKILGLAIKEVIIHYDKMIKTSDAVRFKTDLIGEKFITVTRRGKYLIFELTNYYLLSHLRMEGKFFYGNEAGAKDKHVHAEFLLSNGAKLRYEDVRKFGTFHLYDKSTQLELTPSLSVLGPEPWSDEFNETAVEAALKWKKTPIKSMLLTQKIVSGLGNIYVDEVLFSANVHPKKKSGDLTRAEIRNVVHYTREILSQAITHKGTTIKTFSAEHGISGEFQNFLQVHTKKDKPCPKCRATILKMKVGGRGTYFCAVCQPEVL